MDEKRCKAHLDQFNAVINNYKDYSEDQRSEIRIKIDDLLNIFNPEKFVELQNISFGNSFETKTIEKYDVIKTISGPMKHYSIVYKVIDGTVYSVPITSKTRINGIQITKSRMFKGSFVTKQLILTPLDVALNEFVFVYDRKDEFDQILREIKMFYSKILKI